MTRRFYLLLAIAGGLQLVFLMVISVFAAVRYPKDGQGWGNVIKRCLLSLMAVVVVWFWKARLQASRYKKEQTVQIEEAESLIRDLHWPLVLIRADDLVKTGRMLTYEEARRNKLIKSLDN